MESFKETINLNKDVSNFWISAFQEFQQFENPEGIQFDLNFVIPGVDQSVSEINSHLLGLFDLVKVFENASEIPLIPKVYLGNLNNSLSQIKAHSEKWRRG